jgi:lysophospholipase L1-like esterase/phosphodiesterase/alkaline phosphatase D-like protein
MRTTRTQGHPTWIVLSVIFVFILCSCGGGGGGGSSPPPPSVTTSTATTVALHAATLNGIVNPHAQATNAWFEWGTDNTLAIPTLTTQQPAGDGSADNTVSAAITGLTFGTTYYYRVVAMNAAGTQKGSIVSFATGTPNSPPTVTTDIASSVTVSGAVLNGTVNPNELNVTDAHFEYGSSPTLVTFSTTDAQTALGAGSTSKAITASLSSFTPGTTYYFRVVATNSAGTSKGAIVSFSTVAQPPSVTTGAVTSLTITGATLNASVNPNGLTVTDSHFEYGTSQSLATFNTIAAVPSPGSGFTSQGVTASLSGLAAGMTYYYRVVATNSAGPSTGSIVSFSTVAQAPTVATAAATSITIGGATLNGTVNPNGLSTTAVFEWGTDSSFTSPNTTSPVQSVGSGLTNQTVTATLTGLSSGTTYYFRVVATNPAGTSKGFSMSFTPPITPGVATNSATFNSDTSAALSGDVNPNGYATIAWFEYGTDPAMNIFSNTPNQSMGAGTATLSLTASIPLSLYNTYYYRAAASSTAGTQKGDVRSFKTGVRYVAVGDSITAGSQDGIFTDGIGYEPILGNLLFNNPYTIANEGVSGATSAYGAATISSTLAKYSSSINYLVLYGTNDADTSNGPGFPVPKDTYKTNMQTIITAIQGAGKIPYLAKVPYTTSPSLSILSIQDYNAAIDELRASNGISAAAPDFYTWFQLHTSQLADGIHPNGTGYQSMAGSGPDPNPNLNPYSWFYALTH